jgi:hypothetical protein
MTKIKRLLYEAGASFTHKILGSRVAPLQKNSVKFLPSAKMRMSRFVLVSVKPRISDEGPHLSADREFPPD